ncbi:penicillin-binding protein, partial [Candidatus Saccharibacteria bacterium]|nr:penicillin-binding protein [Candidatus Saccharibacteria bacterium]
MAKDKTASKKRSAKKSASKRSNLSLYSNLAYKHKVKEDQRARKQAEELAKLPKNPILRFFARLRPDRVFKWWFSKRGQLTILKILAVFILLGVIGIGGLFLYYKKDLSEINPEELASRVQDTVNVYLDRNGEKLWEDKGSGDYRLVVDGADISTYMRQATVAIEDKNFYNHIGVDFTALLRAAYMTISGKQVQGGSTLTQQLIKQVYFSDEAKNRTVSGIPRKIKEMILSIEVEKMYDKEQLITLYLNESPYGGRRNGVESAARTYFGKSAKDLDLAESALLAAIPNNPAILNPYYTAGNEKLIKRQHKVLTSMREMGYITEEQEKEAKEVDILARVLPESDQYENILAPWFVLEVKSQLEEKYGIKTMREGGFTITTSLDLRAQRIAEEAVAVGAQSYGGNGSDNTTLVSVDVETGQVVAMVGSVDWNKEGYGQVNAATSLLEPASSIKPILDYTPLFMQREGVNWGPGSILPDNNIDAIYCKGTRGACKLRNASGKFYGNITIRQSLSGSLNIGAVKALYINGIDNSLEIAHALGDKSYCANGENAGLSMAIGGGCSV